jgi:uncharacterized glyoxalase superfamily protein PhnB
MAASASRAASHRAQIVQAPADYPYGHRQYTVEDLGGTRWTFSETIADVAPEAWGGATANAASPGARREGP